MSSPLLLLFSDPAIFVALICTLVISVTIHEFAHAWTAKKLGDDTPVHMGRVTLNPSAHLDPMGSMLFLLFGFGWGKPVVYNPMRLKRHVDELIIALAGPLSNILVAIGCNLLLLAFPNSAILGIIVSINILLASFNLLPIPPLDGSSIIAYFWPEFRSFFAGQVGFVILLLVIFLPIGGGSLLQYFMQPISFIVSYISSLGGLL